jgi:hypothetical protein
MGIVERKVKPERMNNNREGYRRYWWQYAEKRGELALAMSKLDRVLAISRVTNYLLFASLSSGSVFAESTVVFPMQGFHKIAAVQSRVHEQWALFLSSSLEERLRYGPSDCLETFPFPNALLDSAISDPVEAFHRQALESISERYHQYRAKLMVSNNEGLTSTYNRFHDPAETSDGILELRRLHDAMDQAVLAAYGWSDALPTDSNTPPSSSPCGFGLDYLDLEDDALLPPDLQERIASGDLFFPTATEACNFQAQLRRYGAVKPSKKLPWRHRWPDSVRDDVLARLLALNAERFAEEQAMGVHRQEVKGGGSRGAGKPKVNKLKLRTTENTEQTTLL